MSITEYKQGQTIKTFLYILDFDGNAANADALPVCKVYFGAAVDTTLVVTKTPATTGEYTAIHDIEIDDTIGAYVIVWTWVLNTYNDLVSDDFRVETYL